MASNSTSTNVEPISSDPVIVNKADAETIVTTEIINSDEQPESLEARINKLEALLAAQKFKEEPNRSRSPAPRIRQRSRSRSPVFIRTRYRSPAPVEDLTIITNTSSLLAVLDQSDSNPDTLVEIQSGAGRCSTHLLYLTSLPIHQAELDKISWVFRFGVEDGWVQKPVNFVGRDNWSYDLPGMRNIGRGRRVDYIDNDYDDHRFDRGMAPVAKFGTLFTSIFKANPDDDAELKANEEKVKFLTVLQAKNNNGWNKVMVSHSRATALVEIFHELINGFSVVFVGAVLKNADVPSSRRHGAEDTVFQQVKTVQQAEELADGAIGIIC